MPHRIELSGIGVSSASCCNRLVSAALRMSRGCRRTNGVADREIRCECGRIARGDENEVVALARAHAQRAHDLDFSRERLLAMALPSPDDEAPVTTITDGQGDHQ
jgi:hypothetical protein